MRSCSAFSSKEVNAGVFVVHPRPYPAMSGILPQAPDAKVFWFFSSEKNIPFPLSHSGLEKWAQSQTPHPIAARKSEKI
jgi:hypothetical protein